MVVVTAWPNGRGERQGWLSRHFDQLRIWSMSYPASSSEWTGASLPIIDSATHLLDCLLTRGFGDKPIVFVVHSMGGLIVKQMLRECSDSKWDLPDVQKILDMTRGVLFLSTPHTGVDAATLAKYITFIVRRSKALRDLEAHADNLRVINRWYQRNSLSLGIQSKVYFEGRKTPIWPVLRWLPWTSVQVVNEDSAYLAVPHVAVVPLSEDHRSICKPRDRDASPYPETVAFIKQLLVDPQPAAQTSVANESSNIGAQTLKPIYRRSPSGLLFVHGYVIDDATDVIGPGSGGDES